MSPPIDDGEVRALRRDLDECVSEVSGAHAHLFGHQGRPGALAVMEGKMAEQAAAFNAHKEETEEAFAKNDERHAKTELAINRMGLKLSLIIGGATVVATVAAQVIIALAWGAH